MGILYLVRHGQASFFAEDYDKLSELGEEQAAKLGEFWIRQGFTPDEAHCGTLKRQRRTAEVVAEVFAASGHAFPEIQVDAAFNEYDADGVVRELLPHLMERDAKFQELKKANDAATETRERYRNFHRMLEAVMREWCINGDGHAPGKNGYETWNTFSARVRAGLKRITTGEGSGKKIALFTSGGPIGTAVQTVMHSPDTTALDLNWRVHNASVSEIAFSRGRFTLSAFNSIAHLDDPRFLTYR